MAGYAQRPQDLIWRPQAEPWFLDRRRADREPAFGSHEQVMPKRKPLLAELAHRRWLEPPEAERRMAVRCPAPLLATV